MTEPIHVHAESSEKETARIEAFSDGVLAIAITLLALELKVPPPTGEKSLNLFQTLLQQWPTYLAFLVSFLFILVIWINHHRLFTVIRRSDNNLLIFNGLLLLTVSIIPFGTALVADYLQATNQDQNIAAMIYSGIFLLVAFAFNLLWRYASYKNRLFDKKTDHNLVAFISRQFALGPILYFVVLVIAVFNAVASIILSFILAIFYVLPNKRVDQIAKGVED